MLRLQRAAIDVEVYETFEFADFVGIMQVCFIDIIDLLIQKLAIR